MVALIAYLPAWRSLVQSCLMVLGLVITNFFIKGYKVRRWFQSMQKDGLPMPPHHPLFGHLKLLTGVTSQLPSDVHGHAITHNIRLLSPGLGPVFYIDAWPFGPQMLVVAAPDAAYQITQSHSLPKFHAVREYMRPMTGGNDLVTMEGSEWKTWRNIFNPGFSSGHLMTLVPDIMKDMAISCKIFREEAGKPDTVLSMGGPEPSNRTEPNRLVRFWALAPTNRVVHGSGCGGTGSMQ